MQRMKWMLSACQVMHIGATRARLSLDEHLLGVYCRDAREYSDAGMSFAQMSDAACVLPRPALT